MPALYEFREFAIAGGLASYGTDLAEGYRQVGVYTGRILNGEKPADLPHIRPSRARCVKATIPRHRRAVFTFGRAGTPLLSASDLNDGATTPPAPAAAQLAAATPSSLAFSDKLPLPLLSRHRLSADLLALLYLQAVDEHAEVLADRNQRPMLVVHLHAQRAIGAL
jgi:hypothetical protein